eukprot:gene12757-14066_t
MATRFFPSKLKSICNRKVIENADLHLQYIATQPVELKDPLLHLMSKRGLLMDANIAEFLHSDVTELDLSESDISDEGLRKVCVCKSLKKLDLNASKGFKRQISSTGLRHIAEHCKQLQIVFLRRCSLINDEAIAALTKACPLLIQLNLEGCYEVTDASLNSISMHSPKITSLNVSRTKVTDEGLQLLSNGCCAGQLKEIHVGFCPDVTDIGIGMILESCAQLQILIFHGCPQVTDLSRERIQMHKMKQITWTVY